MSSHKAETTACSRGDATRRRDFDAPNRLFLRHTSFTVKAAAHARGSGNHIDGTVLSFARFPRS